MRTIFFRDCGFVWVLRSMGREPEAQLFHEPVGTWLHEIEGSMGPQVYGSVGPLVRGSSSPQVLGTEAHQDQRSIHGSFVSSNIVESILLILH